MKSYSSVSIMKSRKCLQFCHCKYISCGSLKTSVCAARNALRKQGLMETQVTPTSMLVPEIGPALPGNPKPRAHAPLDTLCGTSPDGHMLPPAALELPPWQELIECFSKQMLLLACCFYFSFSESNFLGKFYFKNRGILGILK